MGTVGKRNSGSGPQKRRRLPIQPMALRVTKERVPLSRISKSKLREKSSSLPSAVVAFVVKKCVWIGWCEHRDLNRRRSFVFGVDLCACVEWRGISEHYNSGNTSQDCGSNHILAVWLIAARGLSCVDKDNNNRLESSDREFWMGAFAGQDLSV